MKRTDRLPYIFSFLLLFALAGIAPQCSPPPLNTPASKKENSENKKQREKEKKVEKKKVEGSKSGSTMAPKKPIEKPLHKDAITDETPGKRRPVIVDFTAQWCPYCINKLNDLAGHEKLFPHLIWVAMHSSYDSLLSRDAYYYAGVQQVHGYPSTYYNNLHTYDDINYAELDSYKISVKDYSLNNKKGTMTLQIQQYAKAPHQLPESKLKFMIWVVESKIIADQSGEKGFEHNNVFRGAVGDKDGIQFQLGPKMKLDFTIDHLTISNPQNCEMIVAVINSDNREILAAYKQKL